jgi:hypothetical protein
MSSKQNEQRSLLSRVAIGLSLVALFAALTGGAYAATQIGSKSIKPNAVKSKQIKDGAVKTGELGNGAVTTDKLAEGAVTTDKLAEGAVTGGKLAANAVDASKVADGSVNSAELADGSVTGVKAGAGVLRDMIIVEDREPNTGETVGATKQAFANCPDGYVMTGGGGRILGDGGAKDIIIDVNLPIVESAPGLRQWFVTGSDLTGAASAEDYAVLATAICVKA